MGALYYLFCLYTRMFDLGGPTLHLNSCSARLCICVWTNEWMVLIHQLTWVTPWMYAYVERRISLKTNLLFIQRIDPKIVQSHICHIIRLTNKTPSQYSKQLVIGTDHSKYRWSMNVLISSMPFETFAALFMTYYTYLD